MFINLLRKEKGFFLIEASVALLIITTVLFTAVPAWIVIQERLESSHQKAVSLIAVQHEMEAFAHYLEEVGVRPVLVNGYTFYVAWRITERENFEEGRLEITWISASRRNESTEYHLLRPRKIPFLTARAPL